MELAPQTTVMTERANTMKTYILRDPQAVEPQNLKQNPRPAPCRNVPAPKPAPGPTLFIGLDVHNDTIAVSLASSDSTKLRRYGIIGGQHDDVIRLLKKTFPCASGSDVEVLLGGRASRVPRAFRASESAVAAALCRRSPRRRPPGAQSRLLPLAYSTAALRLRVGGVGLSQRRGRLGLACTE